MSSKDKFTRIKLVDDPHLGVDLEPGLFAVEDLSPNTRGLKIEEMSAHAGHIALAEEGRTPPEHRQSPVEEDKGVAIRESGPKPKPAYIPSPQPAPEEPVEGNYTHGRVNVGPEVDIASGRRIYEESKPEGTQNASKQPE